MLSERVLISKDFFKFQSQQNKRYLKTGCRFENDDILEKTIKKIKILALRHAARLYLR